MTLFKPGDFKNQASGQISVGLNDASILDYLNPNNEDEYIDARKALHNSDIFTAVNILSGDLATMKVTADSPRTQSLLDNPSNTSNGHAFWQSMFAQLLLGGEAFAYRWRNRNGIDVRLQYLRPSQVSTYELSDGSGLIYDLTFDEPDIGVVTNVPMADMIHIRLMSKNGGMTGVSPLVSLRSELEIKKASNRLTLQALKQSVMAPGILKENKGGLLNAKQKAARSKTFMAQANASDGGPIVLDDLEDYSTLEVKSNVAQLLSQTDWTSKQIAKVFDIPDSYLNGQGDQQSSIVQIQGMYTNALNRYAKSIIGELDDKFNTHITYDLRPSIDPLGDLYATQISAFTKQGTLANNQSTWLLQQTGYLPADLPPAKQQKLAKKGGENEDDDENSD